MAGKKPRRYAAGNKRDAETLWLKTLEVNPDYIEALRDLYGYYRETGDTASAYRFYQELVKRNAAR